MNLFSWRQSHPASQIWECRPLVIFHDIDGVVFAANAEVEYRPSQEGYGHAKSTTATPFGWHPEIEIQAWQEPAFKLGIPGYQPPRGRTLYGQDDEGDFFSWYIGHDATQFLLGNPEGELGQEIPDGDNHFGSE